MQSERMPMTGFPKYFKEKFDCNMFTSTWVLKKSPWKLIERKRKIATFAVWGMDDDSGLHRGKTQFLFLQAAEWQVAQASVAEGAIRKPERSSLISSWKMPFGPTMTTFLYWALRLINAKSRVQLCSSDPNRTLLFWEGGFISLPARLWASFVREYWDYRVISPPSVEMSFVWDDFEKWFGVFYMFHHNQALPYQ